MRPQHRWLAAVALAAANLASTPASRPAIELVDNPQYALWAKFRPGSSATLTAEFDGGGDKGTVRLELKRTLQSVGKGGVVVTNASRGSVRGRVTTEKPVPQLVAAQVPAAQVTPAGTADVTAMGRSFACHVYQVSAPTGLARSATATAYLNDGVPGGVVRLVTTLATGQHVTFTLAATDVK